VGGTDLISAAERSPPLAHKGGGSKRALHKTYGEEEKPTSLTASGIRLPVEPAIGTLQAESNGFCLAGIFALDAIRLAGLFGWQPASEPKTAGRKSVELETGGSQLP
jgi:hypothetical protein